MSSLMNKYSNNWIHSIPHCPYSNGKNEPRLHRYEYKIMNEWTQVHTNEHEWTQINVEYYDRYILIKRVWMIGFNQRYILWDLALSRLSPNWHSPPKDCANQVGLSRCKYNTIQYNNHLVKRSLIETPLRERPYSSLAASLNKKRKFSVI